MKLGAWMRGKEELILAPNTLNKEFGLYRVAAVGTLYHDVYGNVGSTHFESIYEIDLENIHEYVLVVSASGAERIFIGWDIAFDLDSAEFMRRP